MLRLGIDTGGTFTDVVAFDDATGAQWTTKVPSTPSDPSLAFMDAVARGARLSGRPTSQLAAVVHGTTVATNAVLAEEGALPGLGLIVTRGFRHILEIARQSVPQGYGNSYFWVKPERIVPLHLVREVTERVDFRGDVLLPFDVDEAEAVARWFRARGITCVGVCFLHAYASGDHEQRMRDVLARVHPAASVSISSEVLPEYREYERAVTTLVDAFVKPRVAGYVAQIEARLRSEVARTTPFYIMKSNGGVVSAREVAAQPISTLLSGPAAGALGAALLASQAGASAARAITLDGGGTSTDVALVEHGVPRLTTEGRVGRYPVKVPMTDVVTVGAGGGSIARRARDGRLKVGPESAGADPGPMCYGRGGREPTVTDAAVALGRLPPHLLGGEIPLDADLARAGIERLAAGLGLDPFKTAAGVLEIAAWSQANAVRQVTVKRGLDVRDYVLVAFGGSGPLQAGRLVEILGLRAALIPPEPGTVSAFGLLTVDVRNDYVATSVQRHDRLDFAHLNATFARLEASAREALAAEGFLKLMATGPLAVECLDGADARLERFADLRYFGQAWEVRVRAPDGLLDPAAAETVLEAFHAAHAQTYGYAYRDQPDQRVEWVNLRVVGIGRIPRPRLEPRPSTRTGDASRAHTASRPVFFDGEFADTPIYDRALLQPGDCLRGPAIVQEFGSTSVVLPALGARVDEYGNLVLSRPADAA